MKRIVVGVDATASSFHAFETALEWAQLGGAELETVSVEELPVGFEAPEAMALAWKAEEQTLQHVLERVRKQAGQAGFEVKSHLLSGNPARAMTEFLAGHP